MATQQLSLKVGAASTMLERLTRVTGEVLFAQFRRRFHVDKTSFRQKIAFQGSLSMWREKLSETY